MSQAPALSLLMVYSIFHLTLTTTMRSEMSLEFLAFPFFNNRFFSGKLKEQFATLVSILLN